MADHFMTLGLPRQYNLSKEEIAVAYRTKARATHPDRFVGESNETISHTTRLSAAVNDAYHTLTDPVARADYMLMLVGGPHPDEMRGVSDGLLVEVMVWREDIDAAKESGDSGTLAAHGKAIGLRHSDTMAAIATAAIALNGADKADKCAMRMMLNEIKYYDRLLDELAA